MEEKILIKSERYNFKKAMIILIIIDISVFLITFTTCMVHNMRLSSELYGQSHDIYIRHTESGDCGDYLYDDEEKCWYCVRIDTYPSKIGYVIEDNLIYIPDAILIALIPSASLALIVAIVYLLLRSYELTVTDKRVFGKVVLGKRVDLPLDSISATATLRILSGVTVSTSSGKISFLLIKNASDIYEIINDLLRNRQQEKKVEYVTAPAPASDTADQLKKYKDLLDSGAITQEEFDTKKKQLLDL